MKRLLVLPLLLLPWAALAHAGLLEAEPKDETQLEVSPKELLLHFSEQIEPAFSSVSVTDASGQRGDTGVIQPLADRPGWVRVEISRPLHGRCEVLWRVVSVDTHVTKGNMAFTVK